MKSESTSQKIHQSIQNYSLFPKQLSRKDIISVRKQIMLSVSGPVQDQIVFNQHLELDFQKGSLNTTCTSKTNILQQSQGITKKFQVEQNKDGMIKILTSQQNINPNKKQIGLSKKSKCFIKQISKVLKKNKIQFQTKKNQNFQEQIKSSKVMADNDTSIIQFKTKISNKGSKTNQQIRSIIDQDKKKKQNFNFEQFLSHMSRKKQNKQVVSARKISHKNQNKSRNPQKKKTVYQIDSKQLKKNEDESFLQDNLNNLAKDFQISNFCNQLTFNQSQNFLINSKCNDTSKFEIQTVKSSRMMSMKQSRRIEHKKKSHEDNLKLQRSLKKAMTNISFTSDNFKLQKKQKSNQSKTERIATIQEQKVQEPLNYAQNMHKIHFDKLKSRVMSKMQDFKKIKEIRQNEQRQKKKFEKKRTFSAQPKFQLTIQGTNMTLNKNDPQPNNFKDKDYKHRRPYTALSRTGLQYDRRQSYRRRSSEKQHKMYNLAGINNSANHFRTFSKNAMREVEQLDECKSDRVVRKLRQKYSSRPQTARSQNHSRRPSAATMVQQNRKSQFSSPKSWNQLGKVGKKQIEKEIIKQKLLGLLVQCEQQKNYNENLKQGLNIFEDYCDNIDQGLKTITDQIDQYIRNDQ